MAAKIAYVVARWRGIGGITNDIVIINSVWNNIWHVWPDNIRHGVAAAAASADVISSVNNGETGGSSSIKRHQQHGKRQQQ